jgi:hypothetical protein
MYCRHCGAEVPDDASLCPACGQTAREAPALSQLPPLPGPTGPPPQPHAPSSLLAERREAYVRANTPPPGRAWLGLVWGGGAITVALALCIGMGLIPGCRVIQRLSSGPTETETKALQSVRRIIEADFPGTESSESSESTTPATES